MERPTEVMTEQAWNGLQAFAAANYDMMFAL